MSQCVFCQILAGRAPASAVYEDDSCLAFMDIRPVNAGHVLVVPRLHAASLAEVDDGTAAHMFVVAKRLAGALRSSGVCCEGINLFLADGRVAGQEVPHVHLHVVPRYEGDGFGLRFGQHYGFEPDRQTLDAIAGTIRGALPAGEEMESPRQGPR